MLRFFFSKLYNFIIIFFIEVLKKHSNFFSTVCKYQFSFFLFPISSFSLLSDEITYYTFSSFFDLFFFSNLFHINWFFFPHFLLFSFFSTIQFYFGNFIFYFYFLTFLFFGCFLLISLLSVVFFFFFFSIVLNFIDFLFKSNLAGLVIFSRDLLSIEDEDLWVSSNIFYFDDKLIEAKAFKTPLTVQEAEVFSTIIKLFFDVPYRDPEYYIFSNQLMTLKNDLKKHIDAKNLNGPLVLDEYLSIVHKNQKIPFNPRRFFLPFFKINNLDDLFLKNPFFLQSSKLFYLNSRIYYPLFFDFLFRLLNFKLPELNKKKNKLKAKREERFKRSYLTFKTKVAYWKHKDNQQIYSSSSLYGPLTKKFPNLKNAQSELISVNNLLKQNQEASLDYYNSLKENVEFFSPSQKFSEEAFAHFRRPTMYNDLNNKVKLQRFRQFFWLSFPLYIIETHNAFSLFLRNNKFLILISTFYKSLLSKFLYFTFSLFGNDSFAETNLFFNYITTPYNADSKIQRINDNFLYSLNGKPVALIFFATLFQSFFDFESTDKPMQDNEDNESQMESILNASTAEDNKKKSSQSNNQTDTVKIELQSFDTSLGEEELEIEEEESEEEELSKKDFETEDEDDSSWDSIEEEEKDKEDTEEEKDKGNEEEGKDKDGKEEEKVKKMREDEEDYEEEIDQANIIREGKKDLSSNEEKKKKFKKGILLKQSLISSKNYVFSNKYNSKSFFFHPQMELVDLYKLLEYFYFVLTNDINFYEFAKFTSRVDVLKQKYGKAIVSDLLARADHKQAKKVSVQMHIVDYDYQLNQDTNKSLESSSSEQHFSIDYPSSIKNVADKAAIRERFFKKQRKSISKKITDNFVDDLILSYKYRFKN